MSGADGLSIGYCPTRVTGAPIDAWRRCAQRSEAVGLDHVGYGDHVSFYVGAGFDGLLGATAVLTASERLDVNTCVYLLPLRHPTLVARQLADLASLAPGRLLFGVGIGGEDPHEVEVCGVDPRTRGRRMDECMIVVRGLLQGEPFDFEGEFFSLSQALIAPAPTVPIPIVVGGRSDAAVSRAGRMGDGWFGIWVSAERYAGSIQQMEEACAATGRAAPAWRNALNVWCGVGADAAEARGYVAPAMQALYQLPYERFEKWSPAGTPAAVADFLVPYVEAGCSTFNLILNGADMYAEIDAAAEIREHMRTAVGAS